MHRIRLIIVACLVVASLPLAADEFWDTKPFASWTDAEVKKVLTSSPWSGKAGISYTVARGASMPTIDETAIVTWSSAIPVRQARAREEAGAAGAIPPEALDQLGVTLPLYVVSVRISGTPAATGYARSAAMAQKETMLRRDGKPPIPAVQAEGRMLDKDGKPVEMPAAPPRGGGGIPRGGALPQNAPFFSPAPAAQRGGGFGGGRGAGGFGGPRDGSSLLVFAFPKSDAITLDDKDVEFVTRVGQYTIKKTFKLSDMRLKGELAL